MDVRDAVEADAEALATLADAPADVMRNLVHDRTVRVAEGTAAKSASVEVPPVDGDATRADDSGTSSDETDSGEIGPHLLGFVSYDARDRTVHVTQLGGTLAACERLLDEPVRFAEGEGMDVELLVPAEDDTLRTAAENAGFEESGAGPLFEGVRTVRYRRTPDPTV